MRVLSLLLFAALITAAAPAMAAEFVDDFPWDPCQAYSNLIEPKVVGGGILARTVLQISINDSAVSREEGCVGEGRAEANDLGPSFLPPLALLPNGRPNPGCPLGDNKHLQRNELRFFKKGSNAVHAWGDGYWYSLTFSMTGDIYKCGSARWVIGQWKAYPKAALGSWPGPVLAQRFDNGVLYVTVSDEECRCLVAKAEGDINALTASLFLPSVPSGQLGSIGRPPESNCLDQRLDVPKRCTRPPNLTLWTQDAAPVPVLPSPTGGKFVTMTYFVKGGDPGWIDIYADGKFIVRVTGHIGYSDDELDKEDVKFKIGQYRDGMPGTGIMQIDRLCLSQNVKTCDPHVQPFPPPHS